MDIYQSKNKNMTVPLGAATAAASPAETSLPLGEATAAASPAETSLPLGEATADWVLDLVVGTTSPSRL